MRHHGRPAVVACAAVQHDIARAEAALARDEDGGNETSQRQARGPFADAFASSITSSTQLAGEQMSFYAALAAYVEPALALPPEGSSEPPFAATDSLLYPVGADSLSQ